MMTQWELPVCARRFASLASKHGDDDMFSSDFTDQELQVTCLSVETSVVAMHCRPGDVITCYLLLRMTCTGFFLKLVQGPTWSRVSVNAYADVK